MTGRARTSRYIWMVLLIISVKIVHAQNSFVDVSSEAGIDHYFIPFQGTFGGGVAVLDFNNDGFEDLFVAGGAGKNGLFRNNGNGTFTDIIGSAGFQAI